MTAKLYIFMHNRKTYRVFFVFSSKRNVLCIGKYNFFVSLLSTIICHTA